MKSVKIGVVVFFATVLSGCLPSYLAKEAADQSIKQAPADKAQIVFLRTTFVGGAAQTQLLEVNNGKLSFIGGLDWGRKMVHLTTPGEKVFMVTTGVADFMKANVEAGKTYYVHIDSRYVAFSLRPYRTDGTGKFNTDRPEFDKWLAETTLMVNTPEASEMAEKNMADFQKAYDTYWPKWQTKTPDQKAELTLRKEDGVNI